MVGSPDAGTEARPCRVRSYLLRSIGIVEQSEIEALPGWVGRTQTTDARAAATAHVGGEPSTISGADPRGRRHQSSLHDRDRDAEERPLRTHGVRDGQT